MARIRRLVRYHEAGHAVVAYKLGVGIIAVDMIGDASRLANVQTYTAGGVAELAGRRRATVAHGYYTDLKVALAGMVAQKLAGYPINEAECASDIIRAAVCAGLYCVLKSLEITIGGIIERAQAETIILLRVNWSAVERVANALGKYDQLTAAELDHIIAHGQRR
jgi:hypothetical protein